MSQSSALAAHMSESHIAGVLNIMPSASCKLDCLVGNTHGVSGLCIALLRHPTSKSGSFSSVSHVVQAQAVSSLSCCSGSSCVGI